MNKADLGQAERIVDALVAPRLNEAAEGSAFYAFFLKEKSNELEPDEVVERFKKGRGVFATELVWDARLELQQRGEGRVVRTLEELRALLDRTRKLKDGMEKAGRHQRSGAEAPHTVVRTGDLSWSADVDD